jgi:Ku protein
MKGYEAEKGKYIELTKEELEAVAVDSTRMIDIDEFVPEKEIDELYLGNPYYIVPDGEVGTQAFAVIREAIKQEGMVALGRVVFTSREHIISLKPRGKGLMGVTLRYPYEVRKEEDFFDEIPDEKVTKDMLDLAKHIVGQKAGHWKPEKFDDRYEDALKDLLKKKQHGDKIEPRKDATVINLMDALRASAKGGSASPASRSPARRKGSTAKKSTRSTARHRKAG